MSDFASHRSDFAESRVDLERPALLPEMVV